MHLQPQALLVVSHSHGAEQLQRKAVISGSSLKVLLSTNPHLSMVSLNLDQILLQMVNLGRLLQIQEVDFYLGKTIHYFIHVYFNIIFFM